MSSNYKEVREILVALKQKILESTDKFSAQTIGNSLYGLQNMSSDRE